MPFPRGLEAGVRSAFLAAAAATGLVAHGAHAHDAPGGGPPRLHLTADPPQLVLGHDALAELRVAAAEDVDDVSLSTSAGRIEDVRRLPGGGLTARYVPPPTRVPQVAIVAAIGRTPRGTAGGWIAIPLSGQANARVRAEPGSEIALTIDGRRFGPRTAGKDGLAVVPIVVPPGVREAHHGFKPIDLRVPEMPLLHAALDRAIVLADRPERIRVLAWVVAPHGIARRGDAPVFEPSRGTVAVVERQPGEIEAVWTLSPGRAGEERISVRLPNAPASRAVLRVDAVAGPPAVVAVSFDRAGVVAGAEEGATVTARALDGGGNAVPAVLAMEAEGGSLSDVREAEPGLLVARLRAPLSLRGRGEAVVRATSSGAGISGTRTVPLLPDEPALARLEPSRGVLRVGRDAVLALRVTDRGDNPVPREPVVAADRGKVVALEGAGPGTWRVRYAAPDVKAPLRARIVASLGAAQAIAEPILLPRRPFATIVASGGAARDARGRFSGARGGVAVELTADAGPRLPLGLELAWRGELELTRVGAGPATAVLAGVSASRPLGPTLVLRASTSAGALAVAGATVPAARLSVDAELERRGAAPFVEAALLAAPEGAPGTFMAVTVSAGIRLGVEKR